MRKRFDGRGDAMLRFTRSGSRFLWSGSSSPWIIHSQRFTSSSSRMSGLLSLDEVEKVLVDVKAEEVKVIPVGDRCGWTDFMIVATGRSAWHVRNIAQALVYKVKQKQKGRDRMLLPSLEGQQDGKWVVIDAGNMVIHALEEKARAYYDLESLWTTEMSPWKPNEDLEKSLIKVRRKHRRFLGNNS